MPNFLQKATTTNIILIALVIAAIVAIVIYFSKHKSTETEDTNLANNADRILEEAAE